MDSNTTHLMQMPHQDIELRCSEHFVVATAALTNIGPVDRVSDGVFAAVRPVEDFGVGVDF